MTLEEFRAIYPEFDQVPDEVIQRNLDLFECLYQGEYGCAADHLQGLFAAHQVYVSQSSGSGPVQAVTSKSAGDVSVSYGANTAATNDFYSTKYGAEFDRLMKLYGCGPVMSSCGYGY